MKECAPISLILLLIASWMGLSLGCSKVQHVKPYEAKRRSFKPLAKKPVQKSESQPGSIWKERSEGGTLFTDVRAFEINDIVTIRIEETATATRGSQTRLGKTGSLGLGGGMIGVLGNSSSSNTATNRILSVSSDKQVDSAGETTRTDDVRFTVAGTVTRVLENGNLYIEGQRVVLVNEEEHHFHISGVARPEDIERDNAIPSYKLAEAHVEFTGRGAISNNEKQGWLTRFLHYIWPF